MHPEVRNYDKNGSVIERACSCFGMRFFYDRNAKVFTAPRGTIDETLKVSGCRLESFVDGGSMQMSYAV